MNDLQDGSELPELSDDDVRLLYGICQRASGSPDPPFKALFSAYDALLREEKIEQEHDGVIFRALLRVGESTVEADKKRQHVDLVKRLEDVLEARGITLIREDGQEEYTGTLSRAEQRKYPARRMSFDDARLEETWLSEHTVALNPKLPQMQPPHSLLSMPPRRFRQAHIGRRARSTSSQRSVVRNDVPKSLQTLSTHDRQLDNAEPQNPTLHFEVSQTQLEINADAMLAISEVRLQRWTLHFLHDQSLRLRTAHKQSSAIAAAHDHQILLRQALETWRGATLEQRYERRHEQRFLHLERKAERARDLFLITKAFTHWATQCSDERFRTRIAQHYVLRAKYFKRWRTIAVDNQSKIRRVLCRKYVAIWRKKTARRSLSGEYAQAWYEGRLKARCKLSMFWEVCSRRVSDKHDVWLKRSAFTQLQTVKSRRQDFQDQAQHFQYSHSGRRALQTTSNRLHARQQDDARATTHYHHVEASKSLWSIKRNVQLEPLYRGFTKTTRQSLMLKALRVWHHHCELEKQASTVRHRMLLLKGSTLLNDGFRSRWIAEFDDARVKQEALYRWHLQTKARRFQNACNARLLSRLLTHWRAKVSEERNQIEYAEAVFAEIQNRRRKHAGLFFLNVAMRQREDAGRAAVEFRNSRDVPEVFDWMRKEHQHVQRLNAWAEMAQFYRLVTRMLRIWSERTTEHKANKRRAAYAHVRAKVKIRLVVTCFARWRGQVAEIRSINDTAERWAGSRLVATRTDALAKWREKAATVAQIELQATIFDQERLLRSALGALLAYGSDKEALQQRLLQSNRATDLALLASALRRLLWESFKAARNHESSEALRLRNRDTHAKQMLRHWATQAAVKRLPANPPPAQDEPAEELESPSIRPASRAASRGSAASNPAAMPLRSPPPPSGLLDSTPGYLRTPSRSRRAGRFRLLPTPAAGTPLAFDSAYLATTPAPLPPAFPTEVAMEGLTPQVTPFNRKLRAGGFGTGPPLPPSALRTSVFGVGGTSKSVRFAGSGSRFGKAGLKNS